VSRLSGAFPFLPVLAGLVLSIVLFRSDHSALALASGLGGVFLMIGVAMRMPASPDDGR
jgi:hypothetical protein